MTPEITMSAKEQLKLKALLTSDEAIKQELRSIAKTRGGAGLLSILIEASITPLGVAKLVTAMENLEK